MVLVVVACGCAARATPTTEAKAEAPDISAATTGALNVVAPVDTGGPIGATDSLIHSAEPVLEPWLALWRDAIPGFAIDSLTRDGERAGIERGTTEPLASVSLRGDSLHVFSMDAPGGRHTLVVDRNLSIIDAGAGVIGIGGGRESAPLLLDRVHGNALTFGRCGMECAFEWGAWVDDSRFVIAGSVDGAGWAGGFIDVCSIADSTQVRYWTRAVTEDELRAYRQAWGVSVQQRYRELELERFRRRF